MNQVTAKFDLNRFLLSFALFATIGLLSNIIIDAMSIVAIPLLFGMVIPIFNWKELGENKFLKSCVLIFCSLTIFYGSILLSFKLGEEYLVIVYIISTLSATGLYAANRYFVPTLTLGGLQMILISVLGFLAIPAAELVTKLVSGPYTGLDFMFGVWTILVGLGFALGHRTY